MFSKKKKEPPQELVRPEDIRLYDLWDQQEEMLKYLKKLEETQWWTTKQIREPQND